MKVHVLTTCKPWKGHAAESQRAAFASWFRFGLPNITVLGNGGEGVEAACRDFGVAVIESRRLQTAINLGFGYDAPLLDSVVATGDEIAREGDVVAWLNADIILTRPIAKTIDRIFGLLADPFVCARRFNVDHVEDASSSAGVLENSSGADVFMWRKGFFARHAIRVPDYIIGRYAYDSWLMWAALTYGQPAVDPSIAFHVCHPRHDYSHLSGVEAGKAIAESAGAQRNRKTEPDRWRTLDGPTWVRIDRLVGA